MGNVKKIFISYSEKDRSRMRSLERIIEKAQHFAPLIIADRRDAFISLSDKVQNGIFESNYIVPILTQNSIDSQWVNQEIGFAIALNKEIIPIVERDTLDRLKGFVHKNIDLPYIFSEIVENRKRTRSKFRETCNLLINDLLVKNNHLPITLELQNIFPGQWKNEHKRPNTSGVELDIEVEIKDGNKYYTQGRHWFNIEKFKITPDRRQITFIKKGIGNDSRRLVNELDVLKLGEVYAGFEYHEGDKNMIPITYSRVK